MTPSVSFGSNCVRYQSNDLPFKIKVVIVYDANTHIGPIDSISPISFELFTANFFP